MGRRADPLRVARAKLLGAERLLIDVEAGLFDRDVEECRSRVAELRATVQDLGCH